MKKVLKKHLSLEGSVTLMDYDIRIEGINYYTLADFVTNFDKWVFKYQDHRKAWFTLDVPEQERKVIGVPSWWLEDGYDESNIK